MNSRLWKVASIGRRDRYTVVAIDPLSSRVLDPCLPAFHTQSYPHLHNTNISTRSQNKDYKHSI